MPPLPQIDGLLEDIYDHIFRHVPEAHRVDCARIALLAAQHRAQQLRQKDLEKANAKRIATKANTGLETAVTHNSQAQNRLSLGDEPGSIQSDERDTP